MKVKFHVCLLLLPFLSLDSYGDSGTHCYNEDLFSFDGTEIKDALYKFDKSPRSFNRCAKSFFEDTFPVLHAISWKYLNPKNSDIFYLGKLNPNRKYRAVYKDSMEDDGHKLYDVEVLSPIPRQNRHGLDKIKTIHVPALFTPRFGKKRYDPQAIDSFEMGNVNGKSYVISDDTMPRLGISKNAASIYLNAGNAFKPRLGRSNNYNKMHLNPGNAFTPRLGRSSAQNLVQLTAGSAFTPRLGRSESYTPENLNAGSVFTPRLGRSESSNQIHLNAGSAFTPRLGRSEDFKIDQRNAEDVFTRRSEGFRNLNDEDAFTPILQTSNNHNMINRKFAVTL